MNNKGSTTIFISLLLASLIVLMCTIIESSRIVSSKSYAKELMNSTTDSCYAGYAKEVLEDYDIFCLWNTPDEIKDNFSYYMEQTLSNSKDMFGLNLSKCKLSKISYFTERNGEGLAKEVDAIMKYKITGDILEEIISKLKGAGNSDKIKSFFQTMSNCMDVVQNIEECVADVAVSFENIKGYVDDIRQYIKEANDYLKQINSFKGNADDLLQIKALYEEKFQVITLYTEDTITEINRVLTSDELYSGFMDNTKDMFVELDEKLQNAKDDLGDEAYRSILEQVNNTRKQISDKKTDYYKVTECVEIVEDVSKAMNTMKDKLDTIQSAILEDSFSTKMQLNITLPDISKFAINYSTTAINKTGKNILEFLKDLLCNGAISMVLTDNKKISTGTIDNSELPSKTESYDTTYKYYDYDSSSEYVRKILFSQYVLDYFSCYTDNASDKKLSYEIEYIIGGSSSDKKNLSSVVTELIGLREGFNIVYLFSDKEKCMEAEVIAAGIVGFTGVTPLVTITKYIILGGWATAESIIDVRMLLEGEEIGLLKTSKSWNTSLTNITSFHENNYKNKYKGHGLNYRDYLRMLLVVQNSVKQVYRTMDMIDINIQNDYNDKFTLKDCIYSTDFTCDYEVNQLFSIFGIKRKYKYTLTHTYSY